MSHTSDSLDISAVLNQVTKIAECIARGDFSNRYQALLDADLSLEKAMNQITTNLKSAVNHINLIAQGRYEVDFLPTSETDELGTAISEMTAMLREMSHENKKLAWIKSGQAELANIVRGDQDAPELGKNILRFLARYINALVGSIYHVDGDGTLELLGSFALEQNSKDRKKISFGEGLIGQCAVEKEQLVFSDIPSDYITVSSSLGGVSPKHIIVTPFLLEKEVVGVMELGAFEAFDGTKMELLQQVSENIARALKSSRNSERLKILS